MSHKFWSRRLFLKATLAGALAVASNRPNFADAMIPPEMPVGKLSLFNIHTSEKLTVSYRKEDGDYDIEALKAINWILRCHYANQETEMDVRTIEFLNTVDKKLGGNNEIHIISGYRSPAYNRLLRHEGHKVARHSLHLVGKAVDIHIPGTSLDKVRQVALNLRYGGVGYYPGKGFVHIDSGKFRTW